MYFAFRNELREQLRACRELFSTDKRRTRGANGGEENAITVLLFLIERRTSLFDGHFTPRSKRNFLTRPSSR